MLDAEDGEDEGEDVGQPQHLEHGLQQARRLNLLHLLLPDGGHLSPGPGQPLHHGLHLPGRPELRQPAGRLRAGVRDLRRQLAEGVSGDGGGGGSGGGGEETGL